MMFPCNMLCTPCTINDISWFQWKHILWFACCNLNAAYCQKRTIGLQEFGYFNCIVYPGSMTIWSTSRRLLVVQTLGTATRQKYSMWQHQWPLSTECPESGCQPSHTITSGQHVSFEARQNTESTQPDRSTTVQPPSGTQDGLCLHASNTSFRTRKNSSPQKTFNWWRLMSMRTFLAPFLPCILGIHNKLLRTTYIKCRKVCCTSYCSMLVNTLRFNSIV